MIQQSFPDTYSTPVRIQAKKPNTNKRYKSFTQTHFTLGDEEQFEQYRLKMNIERSEKSESNSNSDSEFLLSSWDKYGISEEATKNTFAYLFQKFKKGIFIQIRQGKVARFLPFSNAFYTNEWHNQIEVPIELQQDASVLPVRYWYSNNGLFRYENPCNETDTGVCQVKNMFEQLCKEYPGEIPDIDFFVNRRDFPLLKKDLTEPYHNIWDSHEQPLVSHVYPFYVPILSSCVTEQFADIPIPTMDDWTRVMFKEGVHFAMTKRAIATEDNFSTPWNKKRELAVFRGSSTGIGIDEHTNIRIKLCKEFQHHSRCNVGITSWNTRYRKVQGDSKLHVIQSHSLGLGLSKSMTLEEQSTYKYIIHVPGHVQAFRLGIELATRSVILLVETDYKLWFQDLLKPWEHYVPVASDLSDLDERITWCLEHDSECQRIAQQARTFYDHYLSKKGCLKYLKYVLDECSRRYTQYPYLPKLSQRQLQSHYIQNYIQQFKFHSPQKPSTISNRTYQSLRQLRVQKYSQHTKTLFQNANTTITLQGPCVFKSSKFSYKLEHELFIGLFGANSLLKHVPNFVYTLPHKPSHVSDKGIYLEYIQGPTMFDYIKSKTFNLNQWMFQMIQVFLSLAVGQRICFFNHNDLCSWNIILSVTSSEQAIDYLVDVNQAYRIYTTCIPVLIDYDKAHIVHHLQSHTLIYPYQTYQDCICLIVNSIYNIMKFQNLNSDDEKRLMYLFRHTLCDPIYCPTENIQTPSELFQFLEQAHKYSHIMFSHKGKLQERTPMDAFKVFKGLYKPSYQNILGHTVKVLNIVEPTEVLEYRNLGRIPMNSQHNKRIHESNLHPFLKLYYQQLQYHPKTEQMFDPIDRPNYTLEHLILPILQEKLSEQLYDLPSKYLDHLNLLLELAYNGGPCMLKTEERKILVDHLQNYLKDRKQIYTYSKHLIKFKLSRNIL